jgi:hypothetical protein
MRIFVSLPPGHNAVIEGAVRTAAVELDHFERRLRLLHSNTLACLIVKLDEHFHGMILVDGNGLEKRAIQVDIGSTIVENSSPEVFHPVTCRSMNTERGMTVFSWYKRSHVTSATKSADVVDSESFV